MAKPTITTTNIAGNNIGPLKVRYPKGCGGGIRPSCGRRSSHRPDLLSTDADGLLLGAHFVGPWATELLAEGYLAVNWEANAADIAALVHPHPTLSEVFGEAALGLTGRSLH